MRIAGTQQGWFGHQRSGSLVAWVPASGRRSRSPLELPTPRVALSTQAVP
ncbi:hypothetical protein K788_0004852 [Paraburkholderia caribensis MBA4]|uniref:Uncharacterized protein n=1 Tax=Paraburkholderia caribensis MBA4 TaxID=1323664 RepID=A0A0P0R816_9BURK|nr:hypothetical protein K788_0004852 [Paraburkholderia caribensis MBA4]